MNETSQRRYLETPPARRRRDPVQQRAAAGALLPHVWEAVVTDFANRLSSPREAQESAEIEAWNERTIDLAQQIDRLGGQPDAIRANPASMALIERLDALGPRPPRWRPIARRRWRRAFAAVLANLCTGDAP